MKYLYVLLVSFVLLYGCTTKNNDEKKRQEIKNSADSLIDKTRNLNKTMDSLNKESKNQDEKLKQMQIELDSLKKRAKNNK
ncbi:MAG: hypothetical protein PHN88_12790 [Ignavibacteria bacterium]|nr:hypothetical protein [Ignavibacteria bacterium]